MGHFYLVSAGKSTIRQKIRQKMMAEIEHGNIRERQRQKAGIEAAKARGVYTGRAVGSTKANPGRARELKKKGLTMDEIATALGVSTRTVTRYLGAR
jgi:DNA invertase Pin-like site-specific DNA recombinase